MWQAEIKNITRIKNSLEIVVVYTRDNDIEGNLAFLETYTTVAAQSDTWLSDLIANRLSELTGLDKFEESIRSSSLATEVSILDMQTGGVVIAK